MVLLLAIPLFFATAARADVPGVPGEQDKPADSSYLLSGDRVLEVNVGTTLQLDWNGVANNTGPTAHAGVVVGGEVGLPWANQRVRPALFAGVKLGDWADETHGFFAAVGGARLRLSPLMWDIFDVYFVARADFDLQPGKTGAFRPGAGLGLRAARLFAVEITWDVTVPLGSQFAGTQHPDFIPCGISFGVLFDACFDCNRSAKVQGQRDLACRLYHAAGSKPADPDVCAAIPASLSATPPLDGPNDGTRAFLSKLVTLLHGDSAKRVSDLLSLHDELLRDSASYEKDAEQAAQRDRRLSEVWTYAPVPTELRAYLGCDTSDGPKKPVLPPTCDESAP